VTPDGNSGSYGAACAKAAGLDRVDLLSEDKASAPGAAPAATMQTAAEGATPPERLVIYEDDAMRAHMLVFSKGVRVCLGKGIALVELKLATAALAQRFEGVRLADERQTVADIRMTDRFVLTPRGKRCLLVFE
jgi:hypothetical protein